MSWLNLNDSLNNLKGQISSFASNVLAEESRDVSDSNDLRHLELLCSQQQEEIRNLQKLNEELRHQKSSSNLSAADDAGRPDANWSWDLPNTNEIEANAIISELKETIDELKKEKQDHLANLELLDSDFQLNTEKLVSIKDRLQSDYNELEEKYAKLQEDNEKLSESKKRDKRELEDLRTRYRAISETERENFGALSEENRKLAVEIEKLNDEMAVLKSESSRGEDAKEAMIEELKEKLKLSESENKILVAELQRAAQSISAFERKSAVDAENCKKVASILEGYEEQVSSLKQELSSVKNEQIDLGRREEFAKLKDDFEAVRKQLEKATEEKEQIHKKYVGILTENVKKYTDGDKPSEQLPNWRNEANPQVSEFSHQVESILNILLDLKCKCENFEKELLNVTQEKTNLLSEKNHEIEKLLQNSEILSQEVITKSQTIKDYENECNELIKNNDMLISELETYKSSSGLQTISESNEDNLLFLETQLESANKKIEELEGIIDRLEKNEETHETDATEEPYHNLLDDFNQLLVENSSLKNDIKQLDSIQKAIAEEKDRLHSSLEKMKADLENTEYQYTELNINMETLREEVEIQKKKVEELMRKNLTLEKLNLEYERSNEDTRSELNVVREKLILEEDARKRLENQVRNLTEKLQNAKMCETSLKLQLDTINRELTNMTEAKFLAEASLKSTLENLTNCQDRLSTLQQENEEMKHAADTKEDDEVGVGNTPESSSGVAEAIGTFENVSLRGEVNVEELKGENSKLSANLDQLKQRLDQINEEKKDMHTELARLASFWKEHSACDENVNLLNKRIEELNAAKNELTNVIITKHQENVTYHNEIQRLSQVLKSEVEKTRILELQAVKTTIDDAAEATKRKEEIERLTDQNNFLREKCEIMAENLLQEQNRVQKILAEHSTSSEKETLLSKKLERLQTHLIEVEEHYTQELLRAEEKNSELQAKMNEIEQREKNSSTMYTSVSIRANQQVETLQHQLQLITNQRDELRKKISDAEDHSGKQEAALANLQFVLEQFQKDKEKDVHKETERIRRQIKAEKRIQEDLKVEIANLHSQLAESKQGLQAASRLSDQLEQSQQSIVALKGEVSELREKLDKSEERLRKLSCQTDGKVDKSLIKNLVIGFVSTNNNLNKDQMQILKIIATVLDFSRQDHDKVNRPQQGWLGSFLSPQTSQGMSEESLSQAFVKFLENESKPRSVPSLLSNNNDSSKSRKNSDATAVPRQSPSILSEVVLPTFADFAQNRNSSSILKDVLKDNS